MNLAPVVVLACLAAPALASGDIHKVPQDHPTIQDAVNVAADGDIILISGGTYPESVTVTSKNDLLIEGKGKVVIDPPSGSGLTLDGCTGCTVQQIRVGGGDTGISLLDCTHCTLVKCRSDLAVGDGLHVDGGQDHTIDTCVVSRSGAQGIALGVGVSGAVATSTVQNCLVIKPTFEGIDVNGTENLVDKCTVLKAADEAFRIDNATLSTNNTFTDCKAIHPGGRGLVVTGNDNTFQGCKVVHSTNSAAAHFASGAGDMVVECKFIKAGAEGVLVDAAAGTAAVHDCKISGPKGNGIAVSGDDADVQGNKISGAHDNGCLVDGQTGTWAGNSATGSHSDGFRLDAGTAGNHLTANKAKGSKGFDLDDQSGSANTIDPDNDFKTTFP